MDDPFLPKADAALIELFRAEAETHLPTLGEGLLAMEKGGADDQSVASMMRAAHSIKGAARIVGIDAAVRLAHVLEDCFTAAKERPSILASSAVDILLQGVDMLQRICGMQPDAPTSEADLESLLTQLVAVKEGRASAGVSSPPGTPAVVPVAVRAQAEAEARVVLPPDLDDAATEALHSRFHEAIGEAPARIRLDFRQVRHVSARALSLLTQFTREAERMDSAPTLHADGVTGPLAVLMRVTGLDRTLIADGSTETHGSRS